MADTDIFRCRMYRTFVVLLTDSYNIQNYNNATNFLENYRVSIIFFAASAYLNNCRRTSPENFGLTSFTGISFIISLYIDCDTSGIQLDGSMASVPLSITFLSNSHLLKDSCGASIPE